MAALFSSGHVVDLVLGVMTVEAALLLLRRHGTAANLGVIDVVAMLLPGALLLLAVRGALLQTAWEWIALCLALALLAHLADLARRLRSARR